MDSHNSINSRARDHGLMAAHQAHAMQEENRKLRAELQSMRERVKTLTDGKHQTEAEHGVLHRELEAKSRLLAHATGALSESQHHLEARIPVHYRPAHPR
jgi:hypothetical protein